MARQVRNKKTTKKEQVNHPSHYNSHPSGIECIEIIRSFDFNLGSSFKYIFRRDEKENLMQDMKKALWYVQDELKARQNSILFFLHSLNIPNIHKIIVRKERYEKVLKVIKTEEQYKEFLPMIYLSLEEADYYPYSISHLEVAEKYIKLMMDEIEGKQKQTTNG